VLPAGPTCHTGAESCFDSAAPALPDLARTIAERAERGDGGSYVRGLLADAREARQRKVGEEAVEAVLAEPGSDHLVSEVADLWFHSMVLLAGDGRDPLAPLAELGRRRRDPAV
jgi:phosphoribosyl-ATP pyrophosphohydrolase